jgi:hypothetical protein
MCVGAARRCFALINRTAPAVRGNTNGSLRIQVDGNSHFFFSSAAQASCLRRRLQAARRAAPSKAERGLSEGGLCGAQSRRAVAAKKSGAQAAPLPWRICFVESVCDAPL